MRKRKLRLALAILLLAVLGGLTWLAVAPHEPPEPVYQGKRLSEWLQEDEIGDVRDPRVEQAVRQAGTNAIPTLLRMLRAHDSKFKLRLIRLAQKQHLVSVNYISASQRNYDAIRGFEFLGAVASNAVPAMIQIYEEVISDDSQEAAAEALGAIGPAAVAAIPALLRNARNTNAVARARGDAALALGEIRANSELVVPVLIKCLKDSEPGVRESAAEGLRWLGRDAKSAVPALIDLLKDPNYDVRNRAEDALTRIDPEAAAKAGIK